MEASSHGESTPEDTLRRLEERLDRATDAAERLAAEAAEAARARTQPPPAGWQVPPADDEDKGDSRSELELLAQVLQAVRELIPPELERRLLQALRELLLAIRALIDWYLERSEQRRSASGQVQDIPIS
jgi:hypothetical protein